MYCFSLHKDLIYYYFYIIKLEHLDNKYNNLFMFMNINKYNNLFMFMNIPLLKLC